MPSVGESWRAGCCALLWATVAAAQAACTGDGKSGGPLGIDRCDEFEATGLLSRSNQKRADALVIGGTLAVALWQGSEAGAGRGAWHALDAMVTTAVTTELMKRTFQRPRPSQNEDPDLWRQGSGHKSFPSGETAMMAAFVTPLIIEHRREHPAMWALAALPVAMGVARMGSQAHWTSDVLAGGAVGVAAGWLAAERQVPLLLLPLRGGVFIGFNKRF